MVEQTEWRMQIVEKIKEALENIDQLISDFNIWWADFTNYSENDVVKIFNDVAIGQLETIRYWVMDVLEFNVRTLLKDLGLWEEEKEEDDKDVC